MHAGIRKGYEFENASFADGSDSSLNLILGNL